MTPEAWAGWVVAAVALVSAMGGVAAYFSRQGADRRAIEGNSQAIAQLRGEIEGERDERRNAIADAKAATDQIAQAVKESLDRRFDEIDRALLQIREGQRDQDEQHAKLLVEMGRSQAQREEAAKRIDRLEDLLIKAP